MRAVILAAGRGLRLGRLTEERPKPLLPVGGRPILEHILEGLAAARVHRVTVVTGYRGDAIEGALGSGERLGLRIRYRRQERQDGTARALLAARPDLGDGRPFLLCWGDVLVGQSTYGELIHAYRTRPAAAVLSVNPVDDPWRGAAVYLDAEDRVVRIVEKPPRGSSSTRWNNAGVMLLEPSVLGYAERVAPSPRGEHELPAALAAMVAAGCVLRALPVAGYWRDLGTGEDLRAAERAARGDALWPEADRARAREAAGAFRDRLGGEAELVVDTPARVNLIGEHTDYNGLPVLPVAIDRGIRIAARRRAGARVHVANRDPRFPAARFDLRLPIAPGPAGEWANYVKAAAVELLEARGGSAAGADLLVDGDVPPAAGLASSSALLVAAGLALRGLQDPPAAGWPSREGLAERLARAERYVGTLSGGMDQAVSLLARPGTALHIDFFPLCARPVPLPPELALVVCSSLGRADKAGAARDAYNRRVIEGRLACRALGRALDLREPLAHLGQLRERFPGRPLAGFGERLRELLPEAPVDLGWLAARLGEDEGVLARACGVAPSMTRELEVLRRARHVLGEADRVLEAERCLREGDLEGLGALLDASHESLREDYQVSTPALDELVGTARRAGALGARLTGAGFGGAAVCVLRASEVERVLGALDRDFYAARVQAGEDLGALRFLAAARGAARVARRDGEPAGE